jgi:phosphopentomutase
VFERLPGRATSRSPPPGALPRELGDAACRSTRSARSRPVPGRGSTAHPGATNASRAPYQTRGCSTSSTPAWVFTNLIETDQVYGHRKDLEGFHGALRDIDRAVGGWLPRLGDDDLLVLTADHGVDMTTPGTDHTREHTPLLAVAPGLRGRHDGPLADVGATVLRWLTGEDEPGLPGSSFA